MTTATARYIQNGFTVNWQGGSGITVPPNLYAASVPEIVYWLGRIFDPLADPGALEKGPAIEPNIIENTDPLLGTEAVVSDIASGGFLVRQQARTLTGGAPVEVYCVDMDAVHGQLNLIFAPAPVTPPSSAEFVLACSVAGDQKSGVIAVSGGPATHADNYRIHITTDKAATSVVVAVQVGMTVDEFGTVIAQQVTAVGTTLGCGASYSTAQDEVAVTVVGETTQLVALSAERVAAGV